MHDSNKENKQNPHSAHCDIGSAQHTIHALILATSSTCTQVEGGHGIGWSTAEVDDGVGVAEDSRGTGMQRPPKLGVYIGVGGICK